MRKEALIIFPILLASCGKAPSSSSSQKGEFDVYLDESVAKTDSYRISVEEARLTDSKESLRWSISIKIENLSEEDANFSIDEAYLRKEGEDISYAADLDDPIVGGVVLAVPLKVGMDPGVSMSIPFAATLPKKEEGKYSFAISFADISYCVRLYDAPEERVSYKNVTYAIGGKEVYHQSVKQGRPLSFSYCYEAPDHISYCDYFEGPDKERLTSKSIINEDLSANGIPLHPFFYSEIERDGPLRLDEVAHIFNDGVSIVPETYQGQTVERLGAASFKGLRNLKSVYLPKSIKRLESDNFTVCPNLKDLYFAGTKEEWDAMDREPIPYSITVHFGISY